MKKRTKVKIPTKNKIQKIEKKNNNLAKNNLLIGHKFPSLAMICLYYLLAFHLFYLLPFGILHFYFCLFLTSWADQRQIIFSNNFVVQYFPLNNSI
jgi:hypothetical protein